MTVLLPLSNHALATEELVPLMQRYQLMPQLLRHLILDQALAEVEYSSLDQEQFYQQHQLEDAAVRQAWLQQQDLSPEQVEAQIEQQVKLQKFQQANWGRRVNTYFLNRKAQLDQVVCSLIHLQDVGTAWELYFRIVEAEESFAELARNYSQGPEVYAGGIVGPVELGQLHPLLAQQFYGAQPGQIWEPLHVGQWIVLARLEAYLPAQLDQTMQQQLLNELLETWLQEQISQVSIN
jgi:parvulin-like peptidyl-prolyl isomerase